MRGRGGSCSVAGSSVVIGGLPHVVIGAKCQYTLAAAGAAGDCMQQEEQQQQQVITVHTVKSGQVCRGMLLCTTNQK